jgi:transcription initiation factor TFIIH subunit 3
MDLYILTDVQDNTNINIFTKIYKLSNISNTLTILPSSNINNIGYILCKSKQKCRILVCTQYKVKEEDYSKILNCAFTAKRFDIRMDCMSTVPNPVLRQCSIITKGLYVSNTLKGLISLLSNKEAPSVMSFHVKCICHKKDVLMGLTCPVCLGVYCKFVPVCKRCKTKFNFMKQT